MSTESPPESFGFGWKRAKSSAELLRWTGMMWFVREGVGRTALHLYDDTDMHRRMLVGQADLIAQLPSRMAQFDDVPGDIQRRITDLAGMAGRALIDMRAGRGSVGLAGLLYAPGSKYGDPSVLEGWAEELDVSNRQSEA